MARRKRNVIDSTDNALDNIVNNSIESPDEKLRRLKLGAMVDGGEKEEEQPDTWTSASEIHNEGADALSKSNADGIQEYNTDGIFQKFNAANDAKFRNEQIIQNFTPEQKTAYNKLTTDEAKNKYLYDIYRKYSLDTDTDTPGVATGYDDTEDKTNYADAVYKDSIGRNKTNQQGSSSSSSTNFNNMIDPKKGILNIIENGIYGDTPLADEYQEINPEPVAPTYDPRREKALQWQKAIVSLGKLAGVISDVKTVNRNGIVNQKEQGTTELNAIDAGIANLRATFAQQYDDYLEADKLYRKELYQAYRQDIANKRDIAKSLIPQYKESWSDSYGFSDADNLAVLRRIKAGRAASPDKMQRWQQTFPYFVYGTDETGRQISIPLTEDGIKNLNAKAISLAFTSDEVLSSALRKYANDFAYDLDGVDISKLSSSDDDVVNAEIGKILENNEAKNKVRASFQKWLKDYPLIASELLNHCTSDVNTITSWKAACEEYGNLPKGTLSCDDEDYLFMVDRITAAYEEEDRQEARRILLSMMHDSEGKGNLINIYNSFYGKSGKLKDKTFAPAKAGEDFVINETRHYKKIVDAEGKPKKIIKVTDSDNNTGEKKREDGGENPDDAI